MSTPKKRTVKSKSEIKDEFDAVVDNHSGKETISAKEAEALRKHEQEVLAKIKNMTPEAVTQAVTAAQFEVQRTLGDISQLIVAKTNELHTVNEAIGIKKAELEQLHGVDVVATAIDVLIAEHNEKKQTLAQEIDETRAAWAREQEQREREEEEQEQQRRSLRAREQDAYTYQTAQQRRAEEDQWRETMRHQHIAERDRRELLEKGWAQREEALKAQEKEIEQLRNDVAGFPDKLKKEVDKQVAIVTSTLSKDHKHQIEMLTQQSNAQQQLLNSELAQERKVTAALEKQVQELTAKLAEANVKVTEVATEALKSASGQVALSAVQKFASESGNNGSTKRS